MASLKNNQTKLSETKKINLKQLFNETDTSNICSSDAAVSCHPSALALISHVHHSVWWRWPADADSTRLFSICFTIICCSLFVWDALSHWCHVARWPCVSARSEGFRLKGAVFLGAGLGVVPLKHQRARLVTCTLQTFSKAEHVSSNDAFTSFSEHTSDRLKSLTAFRNEFSLSWHNMINHMINAGILAGWVTAWDCKH